MCGREQSRDAVETALISENFILANNYEYRYRDMAVKREPAGGIYSRYAHVGPDNSHADPLRAPRPARHKNLAWRKNIAWYSLPLPIICWALWQQPVCRLHLVELPSQAKPANRCNLPIAGAAVQMNRVQYFSLSALVREDKPIFVMLFIMFGSYQIGKARWTCCATRAACMFRICAEGSHEDV